MKTINKNVCQWCGSKNIESFANDSEYSDITYQYFICNDCGAMYRFKRGRLVWITMLHLQIITTLENIIGDFGVLNSYLTQFLIR